MVIRVTCLCTSTCITYWCARLSRRDPPRAVTSRTWWHVVQSYNAWGTCVTCRCTRPNTRNSRPAVTPRSWWHVVQSYHPWSRLVWFEFCPYLCVGAHQAVPRSDVSMTNRAPMEVPCVWVCGLVCACVWACACVCKLCVCVWRNLRYRVYVHAELRYRACESVVWYVCMLCLCVYVMNFA